MKETDFVAAIEKLATAPPNQIFESAVNMFEAIQRMDEHEVVAFWRAVRLFWEMNPGRNTTPSPVIRQLLETAWAQMIYIRDIGSMGDECVLINQVIQTYRVRGEVA